MGDPILDPIRQQPTEPITPPIAPEPAQPKQPGKFGKILGSVLYFGPGIIIIAVVPAVILYFVAINPRRRNRKPPKLPKTDDTTA